MPQDTNVQNLIINKLTQAQYNNIANPSDTELYLTPDTSADVDLNNVSNTSGFRKLVELYTYGASWYKIYNEYDPSTGDYKGRWCEQGGAATTSSSNNKYTTTVTLLKEFEDTSYNITFGARALVALNANNLSSTSFAVDSGVQNVGYYAASFRWRAEGYIK